MYKTLLWKRLQQNRRVVLLDGTYYPNVSILPLNRHGDVTRNPPAKYSSLYTLP